VEASIYYKIKKKKKSDHGQRGEWDHILIMKYMLSNVS
jgi:hypothetical protein